MLLSRIADSVLSIAYRTNIKHDSIKIKINLNLLALCPCCTTAYDVRGSAICHFYGDCNYTKLSLNVQ